MEKRRQQLQQLSQEELITSHLLLEDRVRTLEKQVSDLRELLSSKLAKTAQNSSVPPGQSPKGNIEASAPAKRGPKKGHTGRSRARGATDESIACHVGACSCCGTDLAGLVQHEVGRHQVIDIPRVPAIVREVIRYGRYCPTCGSYQRASAPAGFETGRVFGANLAQTVLYLHYAHPLSYKRVQQIVADLYGLSMSEGALVNLVRGAQSALQEAGEGIHEQLQLATVIGCDETGMRVAGSNYWQWVFQTPQLAYFVMDRSRAAQVIANVMGATSPEIWTSDVLSSQMCHPAQAYQICLAHQVRDLQYALDAHSCDWANDMQRLFYEVMVLGKQRESVADYRREVQLMNQRLDRLLAQYPTNEDSQRLWRRFRKHRAALLLFLARSDVPPTNNASEQALRNSVIYRKVTGGFRTDWGAELYANVISILETARRQGQNIFDTLAAILASQPAFSWQGE